MKKNMMNKMIKARSILILDHPFFGSLALHLKLREDKEIPTAMVDGEYISFNPDFIRSLTLKETIGLMGHEVMHMASGHHWRQNDRDNYKWNIAGDYAINGLLIKTGFTLPKEGLYNSDYDGYSAEEIYTILPPEDKSNRKKRCIDPGGCGAVKSVKNKEEIKLEKAKWQAAVSQALQISKGTIPSDVIRQIHGEILDPPLPWYILLRDFIETSARNDYNWRRPSRRYLNQGFILPGLISEELKQVVIAIDTSGSITGAMLKKFAKETSNVLAAYDTTITIIHCDARVNNVEEYTRADLPLELKPMGGGGTNFCPTFEYINEQGINPSCFIYFTDLYGTFPTKEPEYPIMWVTPTKDKKAPFGRTIEFR